MDRVRHRLVALLVCVLAIGVFTLASVAKCSQYHPHSRSEGYFAKATKMSGERCQTSEALALPPVVLAVRVSQPEPRIVAELPEPDLPTAVFLDSFRFRPPPARLA